METIEELEQACRRALVEGKPPELIHWGDALLARRPDSALGLCAVGSGMLRSEKFGIAAQLLGMASGRRPNDAEIWNNFACALQEYHPGQALECLQKAMQLDPELDAPIKNCVGILSTLGRFADAVEVGLDCLKREPEDQDVNHNIALALMQLGRWKEAWPCWYRSLGRKRVERFYGADVRRWDGHSDFIESPDGAEERQRCKVVIYGEQGLGDEILAAAMLDRAIASGAEILLECDQRLEGLFRRSFPQIRVEGTLLEEGIPYWVREFEPTHKLESMGLGELYAPEPFRRKRYLKADPQLRAMFRGWLDTLGPGIKVGLSWRGGHKPWDRAQRCIPKDLLGPIVKSPGCRFVSLEYDDPEGLPVNVAELPFAVRKGIDYDLTAALIAELDLVVTVPQTVVDAAGAVGTPCWVMVPPVPQWRFSEAAGDEAWVYHGVEVFRRKGEFWQGLVATVTRRLRTYASIHNAARKAAE